MANTYTLIQTINLTSGQTSLDFQNIPNTYKEIALHYYLRNTGSNGACVLRFNNTSTNYYNIRMTGAYTQANPSADAIWQSVGGFGCMMSNNWDSNYFSNGLLIISHYANTSKDKNGWYSTTSEVNTANHGGAGLTSLVGLQWNNTSAISRITITSEDAGANIAANSFASLYGIA
jgi:hypothetical protein